MILACSSCVFVSLANAIPFFETWMLLFIPAALAVVFAEERSGARPGQLILLVTFLGGCVFFGISTVLGALLIPLAYLVILLLLLARSFSPSKAARVVSVGVLIALVASALYAVAQAKSRGPAWQLSRPQGSAHGGSFAQRWAKDLPIPLEQLMRLAVSGSELERTNATDVLKEMARQNPSPERLETELRILLSLPDLTEVQKERAYELAALLREV